MRTTTTLVMKQNIKALLAGRGLKQKDLADWCGLGESWASKGLSPSNPRAIPIKYWDKIADFLGVSPYELLQPGLSLVTERRSHVARRSGKDRRLRSINVTTNIPHTLTVVLKADEVARLQRIRLLTADDLRELDALLQELSRRRRGGGSNTTAPGGRES